MNNALLVLYTGIFQERQGVRQCGGEADSQRGSLKHSNTDFSTSNPQTLDTAQLKMKLKSSMGY